MRRILPCLCVLSPVLLLAVGCFEDPTSNTTEVGDPDTSGDGDGDPTTGDGDGDPTTGDGDGDPTTGDGDGDPTTGDGDGDPTTGDGDGDATCNDEYIVLDMFAEACDMGMWWTYDGAADSHPMQCNTQPPGNNDDGWGRVVDPANDVEGTTLVPKGLEIGSWSQNGGFTGVDFAAIQIADLCEPRLKVSVGCGYGSECKIEYRVQIKDNALPFNAPPMFEAKQTILGDGTIDDVEIDLVPYQNKVINVTLMVFNEEWNPADMVVYGWPRIVANQ